MRILVADDDPVTTMLVKRCLEGIGHQVTTATDGEHAWQQWSRNQEEVVITDWRMPRLDGLDLTRRIRASRNRQYTWVMLLTSETRALHHRAAIDAGVDDFIEKPLDRDLLTIRLKVAERVTAMDKRLAALARAMPICMHCKSVRPSADEWLRIEEYVQQQSGAALSHGYCPDCLYTHELSAEVQKWRSTFDPPNTDRTRAIDHRVLDSLRRYDAIHSPGLADDLVTGLRDLSDRVQRDLKNWNPRHPSPHATQRVADYRQRCLDLGAGRMASAIDAVMALDDRDPPPHVRAVLVAAVETVSATLEALGPATAP